MESIKSQTFTEEQLVKHIKSTYDQSIKQYSRLTKRKKYQQEPTLKVSETLWHDPRAIIAAN